VRIFCYRLEAELISIAGYYKLHDDIKVPKTIRSVQIYLENEKLNISSI
jgi:septum formation inhibitor MinC